MQKRLTAGCFRRPLVVFEIGKASVELTTEEPNSVSVGIGNSTFSLAHVLVCKMSKHTSIIVVAVLFFFFFG